MQKSENCSKPTERQLDGLMGMKPYQLAVDTSSKSFHRIAGEELPYNAKVGPVRSGRAGCALMLMNERTQSCLNILKAAGQMLTMHVGLVWRTSGICLNNWFDT